MYRICEYTLTLYHYASWSACLFIILYSKYLSHPFANKEGFHIKIENVSGMRSRVIELYSRKITLRRKLPKHGAFMRTAKIWLCGWLREVFPQRLAFFHSRGKFPVSISHRSTIKPPRSPFLRTFSALLRSNKQNRTRYSSGLVEVFLLSSPSENLLHPVCEDMRRAHIK